VAVAIPLTFAACGDDDETTSAAGDTAATTTETAATGGGGGETIDISETEFALDPSDPTAAAGAVTFNVSNDGSTVHDLEVEGNGIAEATDPIEAGSSAELTVDLEPGEYKIYCTIGDHAAQGMEGTLTVN
jgi:plastocyanin